MPPKINGNTISDLVRQELDNLMDHHKKEMIELSEKLEDQLNQAHEQLLGALARITCLENELTRVQHSPKEHSSSKNSSKICRHWLRNNCTWKEKCRFSHEGSLGSLYSFGGSASARSASQPSLNSSFQDKKMKKFMKTENTDTSIAIVNIDSDEKKLEKVQMSNVHHLLIPKHPERQKSETSNPGDRPCLLAPPAAPTIGHKVHGRSVNTGPKKNPNAALPRATQKDENWPKSMLEKVNAIEEKYSESFSPKMGGDGFIHSAKVMIPKIDFSKVKPHLHQKLPKPGLFSVQGCSPDSDFYHKATEYNLYDRKQPKFQCPAPFGMKAAFETNLGLVAVPEEPIGGYIYKSGGGASTIWQLFAEPIYI